MKSLLVEVSKNPVIEAKNDTMYVMNFTGCVGDTKYLVTVNLNKPDVMSQILALYNLADSHALNFDIEINHNTNNTSCTTNVKGVLHNKTSSDFTGKIIIPNTAQQTSSYLSHDVLVVGEDTNNQTRPILQIDANDVKASHSATTGRVSPDELYYLCSRGLSTIEAEKLIVEGFFDKELAHINDKGVLEVIKKQLDV